MPATKNMSDASQKRCPQRFKQQGRKTNGGPDVAAVSPASAVVQSKSQRSSGRSGPRRGRAGVAHKVVQKPSGAGHGVTATGKAGESCAWPAYARSEAEAEEDVLQAIKSLYSDELKPFGRILRKRVAERILQGNRKTGNITKLDALPEVDSKQVRHVCEACELLQVEEEDGGDWSAVLVDHPSTFVDVYSSEDCYQSEFWSGLRAHCESVAGQALSLPGGRYACAQSLMALRLPLLAEFSLGRICHIVQLAISQKKILGYMNGAVVPYARSQSMVKEQCAMYGQPTIGNGNNQSNMSSFPLASLEVTRNLVLKILDDAKGEAPLSNIKRLFRSRFQMELSETSFGYSKLSELLQGPSFSDICRVELRGHGYTVIQTGQLPLTSVSTAPGLQVAFLDNGSSRVPLCPDEPLAFDDMSALTDCSQTALEPSSTPTPVTIARRWCVSPSKDSADGFVNCSVQHTFLQYKVPQTPLPGPKSRSHSVPTDMGRRRLSLTETCPADDKFASARTSRSLSKFSHESDSTTDGSGTEEVRKPSSHKRTDSSSSVSTELSNDEASFGYVPQLPEIFWGRTPGTTPLPLFAPETLPSTSVSSIASTLPSELASLCGSSLGFTNADDEMGFVSGSSESGSNRVTFCPDEPLGFDESEFFPPSPKASPFPTPAVVPPTPSPLPLHNYSETIPWRRHPICSSLPPPPPIATAPSSIELGCSEVLSTQPPAHSGSAFSNSLQAPQHALYSGRVIRLGEYL